MKWVEMVVQENGNVHVQGLVALLVGLCFQVDDNKGDSEGASSTFNRSCQISLAYSSICSILIPRSFMKIILAPHYYAGHWNGQVHGTPRCYPQVRGIPFC